MPSVRNATDYTVINGSTNDNKTETSYGTTDYRTDEDYDIRNLTTRLENTTTQSMKVDSFTTISDSTSEVLDSATTSSDLVDSSRGGPELTTVPSHTTNLERFESTGSSRSWVTQTEGKHQTTAEEKKDKNKEDKDKGKNEEKDGEEENELRDVQNVRRLIDEGEDLENQLKRVFLQLRSLSQCSPVGEKCGVREGLARCCKGLKCNATWSGICKVDCVPFGQSCSENFFCCSGSQCMKSIDRKGQNNYICQ